MVEVPDLEDTLDAPYSGGMLAAPHSGDVLQVPGSWYMVVVPGSSWGMVEEVLQSSGMVEVGQGESQSGPDLGGMPYL